MKLLIENQCLCTFLFITSFLNSNGGLIWAHVHATRYTILTQTLMTPKKSILKTHNGTYLLQSNLQHLCEV